jgi:hypothetical protein
MSEFRKYVIIERVLWWRRMRRRCEEWEVFRGIIIRSWEEGIKGRGILWSIYYEGEIYCKKEENEIYSFKIDKR